MDSGDRAEVLRRRRLPFKGFRYHRGDVATACGRAVAFKDALGRLDRIKWLRLGNPCLEPRRKCQEGEGEGHCRLQVEFTSI
jgi:hypothetical protein